jgi:hypothetical protein
MAKSLLIIDDEPEILEIYEEILEGMFTDVIRPMILMMPYQN